MAKKQTRRAVSVQNVTYQRLKRLCEEQGVSVSSFVETVIHKKLDELGVPQQTVLERRPLRTPEVKKHILV